MMALIAGSLLASCSHPIAAPTAASPPPLRLESIGAEVKSWGVTLRRWSVDSAGRVEHVSGERPGRNPTDVVEVRRLSLSDEQMRALGDAAARVEAVLQEPEQCDSMLTDGLYGSFRWSSGGSEQSIRYSANCVKGRDARLASAIFDADEIVDEAAKALEPVERRSGDAAMR